MGLFNNPEEQARRAKLKAMEDRRVAFAQRLAREGFAPERMLFAQTANGGYAAVCREKGQFCLIVSPGLGTDEDFALERFDAPRCRVQEVYVAPEGMGGIFGFGKKSERGMEYIVTRLDGSEVSLPFVMGRNGWMEVTLARNPLLKTQRRRNDANIAWDMRPLDGAELEKALRVAKTYFPE